MLFESIKSTSVAEGVADTKVEGVVQAMVQEKVWLVPAAYEIPSPTGCVNEMWFNVAAGTAPGAAAETAVAIAAMARIDLIILDYLKR